MMLELVDKLIDRCIQLIKAKKQHSHDLFIEFVQPVFAQFEAVHNFYLTTFEYYNKLLDDPASDVRELYATIRHDNVFSEHLRQKLRSLTEASDSEITHHFIEQIHDYLLASVDYTPYPLPFLQQWEFLFLVSSGIAREVQEGLIDISSEYPKSDINKQRRLLANLGLFDADIKKQLDALKRRKEEKSHIRTWGDYIEELNTIKIAFKRRTMESLEQTVCKMQKSYKDVIAEYTNLKKILA